MQRMNDETMVHLPEIWLARNGTSALDEKQYTAGEMGEHVD